MDGDFIERLQRINLNEEEGEVCQVRATQRKEILEECSLMAKVVDQPRRH